MYHLQHCSHAQHKRSPLTHANVHRHIILARSSFWHESTDLPAPVLSATHVCAHTHAIVRLAVRLHTNESVQIAGRALLCFAPVPSDLEAAAVLFWSR